MYLLYPTVHFQNLERIVQGLDIFLGIKTLCHSLLVMYLIPFDQLRKVIAASAQNVWVVMGVDTVYNVGGLDDHCAQSTQKISALLLKMS